MEYLSDIKVGDIVRLMLPQELVDRGIFTQEKMDIICKADDDIIARSGELFIVERVTEASRAGKTAVVVVDMDGNTVRSKRGYTLLISDIFEVVQHTNADQTDCCYDTTSKQSEDAFYSFLDEFTVHKI